MAPRPIFISFSSKHTDLTVSLARTLEERFGKDTVWWHDEVQAGDTFAPDIVQALDAAKAVVVVWTKGAVASNWVYAEAVRAAAKRKIVTVRAADLDPDLIPLPFNVFHTDLVEDTRSVIDAVAKRLGEEPSPLPSALPGPGFRNFLLDPKQEALPRRAMFMRPASLLLAKHRLVPFVDYHGLKRNFVEWATGEVPHAMGSPVLGRLVHGAGGLGKTRALIEIADALTQHHGWLAGFVPREVRGAGRELSEMALDRLIQGGAEPTGLMLIVDYAESRQDDVVWLADRLLARAETNRAPARLVLLSRGSGVWWKELVLKSQSLQDLFGLGGDAYDEIEIREAMGRQDRRALFDAAVRAFIAFRDSLPLSQVEAPAPPDDLVRALETESDYDRPLAVQIAALLYVSGIQPGPGRHSIEHLVETILGVEYAHWDTALETDPRSNWPAAIRNGVAQITLVGGIADRADAEKLIARDPLFREARDIDVPRVRRDLALLFPAANDGLATLEPDLLGEHHVASTATDALVDACLDWAGEAHDKRQHILTVLNRATRPEHGAAAERAAAQLARLIETRGGPLGGDLIKVAVETPGRLLELCAVLDKQVGSFDEETLAEIDAALPEQSLALMELSLHVAERRLMLARQLDQRVRTTPDVPAEIQESALDHVAALVGRCGNRLSYLGRREEALAASQEAVDIRRRLAAARPDAYLPDLAMNVNNLSGALSSLGRHEDALATSQEAVDLYRRLAATRPDAFLPDLATSLNNLSRDLTGLGRPEDAVTAAQEAVDIHRRLAAARPDDFLPNLAISLSNSAVILSNLGRHEETLAPSQDAVNIYRRLAATRPDTFLPGLAMSLNTLSGSLAQLGRREEALVAIQATVEIRRRLAATRPDAFLLDLAGSLNNLSLDLSNLGRDEEALVASQEAVAMNRRLAATRPDAFLPGLAMSLTGLGSELSSVGQHEAAMAATKEAVDIYRRLATTRPDSFLPEVARGLAVHGRTLAAADRHADAQAARHEGLTIIAPFVEHHPQAFADLANALGDDYFAGCQKAGSEPDRSLLDRISRALSLAKAAADPKTAALIDQIGAIVQAAEKSGTLDETALARLPQDVAERLRTAWAKALSERNG